MKHSSKRFGRPPLYPDIGTMKPVCVRLDPAAMRRLRRLGHGNLSAGIRKAAESRRFKKYRQLEEAIVDVVAAYDCDHDLGPALQKLLNVLHSNRQSA